jgi:hypothetical protein
MSTFLYVGFATAATLATLVTLLFHIKATAPANKERVL